jgi:transposase
VILLPSDHFGEDGMTLPLAIRTDLFSSTELRAQARRTRNRRTAMRMLAIANALEGMSRADAARVVGMERQALRDAVIRYNTEGLAGLQDRPKPGRRPCLNEAEQAVLRARILQGPDPARDGCQRWTLPLLCRWIETRFNKRLHPASLSRIVRGGLDLSRQKTRPVHPQADQKAQMAFVKGGCSAL